MKSLRYGSLKSFVNHLHEPLPVRWDRYFGRSAPLEVEIGFGTGEYIVQLAQERPNHNFLGIEENIERIHKTLRKLDGAGLNNVRLLHIDARLAFERYLTSQSLCQVHCLFPCPWPRKNQMKHRLFGRKFIKLLNNRLCAEGKILLVTDHPDFAQWVRDQSSRCGFRVDEQKIKPTYNTKFERKWLAAGQKEFYSFQFNKVNHLEFKSNQDDSLKVYFFDQFNFRSFRFEDHKGNPSVIFKEFFFDEHQQQGMVHLLVAEDYLQQHLWAKIIRTAHKGWCLAVADGTLLIPTAGVAQAMELLFGCVSRK